MTAIIRTLIRTVEEAGIAVVADGRRSNAIDCSVELDTVQKIFCAKSSVGTFAVSFAGATGFGPAADGETLDLVATVINRVRSLQTRKTGSALGYANRLGRNIIQTIKDWNSGPIISGKSAQPNLPNEIGDTIFRLALDGFETSGKPALIDMRFFHLNGELREPEIRANTLLIGRHFGYSPSPLIGELVFDRPQDNRLSGYKLPEMRPDEMTLKDAIERSTKFISVHTEQEAIEIDSRCRTVGGQIHAAIVTPERGFEWVIQPQTESHTDGGTIP
jgi:hypothetical protein